MLKENSAVVWRLKCTNMEVLSTSHYWDLVEKENSILDEVGNVSVILLGNLTWFNVGGFNAESNPNPRFLHWVSLRL